MENFGRFQKEYINENNDILYHKNFKNYLIWALEYVQNIQFDKSKNKKEVPLTFYPIAKNIRIPSSHMARNILNNQSSYINNYSRDSEEQFWNNQLKRGHWYPWLWARTRVPGNYKNIDGWAFYFDSFTENHKPISEQENNTHKMEPPTEAQLFFIYLACIKYTFQLNHKYLLIMENFKKEMEWPENTKVLAVQIRRGEVCTKDGLKTDREYFDLKTYIKKIELLMNNNNYEYIYISTDSNEEIDKIQAYNPSWKLLYLPIDRTKFFRMSDNAPTNSNGLSTGVDLEDSCRLYPDSIPFIVDSALADLYFISQCQGYISTIGQSEFSRCGWYLQLATQEKLLPYVDMNTDAKPLDVSYNDFLLLL